MTFQFLCPQGHLLEGEEAQMGQQCDCPMCGTRFIIPTVESAPAPQSPQPSAPEPSPFDFGGGGGPVGNPFAPAEPEASEPAFPNVGGGPQETSNPFDPTGGDQGPRIYHIPCPNGHELETPDDMIGQDVMCPFCGEQFSLRMRDSVEYKKQKAEERERRDQKVAKMWYNWAIVAAVVVVLGLGVMFVLMFSR